VGFSVSRLRREVSRKTMRRHEKKLFGECLIIYIM
jgi:hypothetical protein